MDLFSEFQQAESTTKTNSYPYENFENKQEYELFRQTLMECTNKTDSECPCHHTLYDDTFLLTGISKDVLTPFSHVVGTHRSNVVIMSNKVEGIRMEFEDAPLNEVDAMSERQQETSELTYKAFTVVKHTQIATSFPIQQKYVYLTHEEPILSESSTFSILVDLGATPIPIDTAKYFCSLYATCCYGNENAKDMPELWILCANSSTRNTVAMGCAVETVESNRQQLNVFKIQEVKPIMIPDSKSYSISLESNYFQEKINHQKKPSSHRKRQKWITSTYEFGPRVGDDDDILLHSYCNPTCIEFMWNGEDACFSPPPVTADAVLGFSVTPGDQFSPVLRIYSEIESLLHFSEIVAGTRNWPSEDEEEEQEEVVLPSSSLSSKVSSFLDESSTQMFRAMEMSIVSPTTELSAFQPRENLDFLGQLWMFVRHVTNPAELVEIFGLVFKAVLLGQVQLFVHDNKTGTIATLFRQSLSCSTNDERDVVATKLQSLLTEEKALQCLIELGVEKLQKDYVNIFTSNGLSTSGDLEVFFCGGELSERCKGLCSLHYVLELAAVLLTFITLPESFISSFLKNIMKYYHETDFEKFTMTPSFQIPFTSLSPALNHLIQFASALKPSRLSASIEEIDPKTGKLSRGRILCTAEPLFKYMYCPSTPSSQNKDTVMCVYHIFCQSTCI